MRSPLFILIAAFILSLLVAQQVNRFSPPHPDGAVDRLVAAARRSPDLGPALAASDRGEGGPLTEWLNSAQPTQRLELASLLFALCYDAAGVKPGQESSAADAVFYRYRRRLAAFANIPTGNDEMDELLDNLLAYVCVAGTATPSGDDVAIARSIVPRLEKRMVKAPAHEVWDTIGCVHFVAGEHARARGAFEEAVRLGERALAKASAADKPLAEKQVALYRTRRQAAVDADRRAVERGGRQTAPPPLPLEGTATPAQPEKP